MNDSLPARRSQFSLRALLILMAVVAAILALFFGRSTDRRDLPIGRYQVVVDKNGDPMMFDTATGQGWKRLDGGNWYELPVPKGVPADSSAAD